MFQRLRSSANEFRQKRQPKRGGDTQGPGESLGPAEAEVWRARVSARGALVVIVVAQVVFACIVVMVVSTGDRHRPHPRDGAHTNGYRQHATLLLSWAAFAVMHSLTWGSAPGYVDQPRYERRRDATAEEAPSEREPLVADSCMQGMIVDRTLDDDEKEHRTNGSPAAQPQQLLSRGAALRRDGVIDPSTGQRWCLFCGLWQPLRTKHCDMCNRCVRRFDHHCFWIGTCVGQRNHCRFVIMLAAHSWFLFEASAFLASAFDDGSDRRTGKPTTSTTLWGWNAMVGGLWVFAIGMLGMVAALLVFHLYLAAIGLTTWELVKMRGITYLQDRPGRFNLGTLRNLQGFVHMAWSVREGGEEEELVVGGGPRGEDEGPTRAAAAVVHIPL